ncbi:MAG: winged helix-turn-helix transcriptional regulator [Phycisphaerales bacterium]|nr:MAG: winged helix-turn-helix transcriptional regulator [Phycisphaerales bacterium]
MRRQSARVAGKGRGAGPFPKLKGVQGCGVLLTVAEKVGGEWDLATRTLEVPLSVKTVNGRGAGGHLRRALPRVCRALAAFGHVQRAEIMAKLLEGPATYRALQHVTKMKAGPLYHHVNQLRLAGLILPKQRDLYELTRGGRNLILAAMVVGPLIRDARRRPVARGRSAL